MKLEAAARSGTGPCGYRRPAEAGRSGAARRLHCRRDPGRAHFSLVLERLPLTPNGKLDRRARNGPEIANSQLPEEAVNVFAESDVIHKSVPVKEPRA